MCGIIAVCHHPGAEEQVKKALTLLAERGKDGNDLKKIAKDCFLGHTLHAIVGHVSQPITAKGTLIANCEIYNWQELSKKYHLEAKNDSEFLLKFLDSFGAERIEELDGVFAFVYSNNESLLIARDILGVKPLWFSLTTEQFACASEKKVLENLAYGHIQELNPRSIFSYDLKKKKLEEIKRNFFSYQPEHTDTKEELLKNTQQLLHQAIDKRVPSKKFGLLFSGGLDSTYLANYLQQKGESFVCYTAAVESLTTAKDLEAAEKVAKELNLTLRVKTIKKEDIPSYLEKIVPLIEDSNVVKVGVALTFYLASELAKEDGCKVLFSGLGSEEIFAGYDRHKKSANINQECVSGLLKMYERDLYRDDVITMANNLELRLPFLDRKLITYALKIPAKYKINSERTKMILREIALREHMPEEFALRKKTAAQYGSKIDSALGKLAKKQQLTKSAYLRQFYPDHNLKLGVLFSSGKDSTYAAYIMQRQNYELTCLLTLQSKNSASYMFHTPAIEMASLQAEAMGIPQIVQATNGEKEEELNDLKALLSKAKEKYAIEGVITGALFSTYQRDRIEKICDEIGLKIFSPLWHKPQEQEMQELLQQKFSFLFTAIAAEGLDEGWLGRPITEKDLEKLKTLHKKNYLNIAGEGGEFESLVLDCPLFKKKLILTKTEKVMENGCTGKLVIKDAELKEKVI